MPVPSNNVRVVPIRRPGGDHEICEPFASVFDYIEVSSDATDAEVQELVRLHLEGHVLDQPEFF